MPDKRLYIDTPLRAAQTLDVDGDAAHYLGRVMRARIGERVRLFNGDGLDYPAQITALTRREVSFHVGTPIAAIPESRQSIELWLALSRNEKMDLALQKAVELGVQRLQPVTVERSVMQLDAARVEKRLAHWRGVAISAAQQCGRAVLMDVAKPQSISHLLDQPIHEGLNVLAAPDADASLPAVLSAFTGAGSIRLAVGPEGGFTADETADLLAHGFVAARAGPRVLRTETAAIALVAAVQAICGDWR
ncbi:MAG: 16S rRNA (uracil(1498)-N(3))-methyltransferase [Pseudomonadota bacterium]